MESNFFIKRYFYANIFQFALFLFGLLTVSHCDGEFSRATRRRLDDTPPCVCRRQLISHNHNELCTDDDDLALEVAIELLDKDCLGLIIIVILLDFYSWSYDVTVTGVGVRFRAALGCFGGNDVSCSFNYIGDQLLFDFCCRTVGRGDDYKNE